MAGPIRLGDEEERGPATPAGDEPGDPPPESAPYTPEYPVPPEEGPGGPEAPAAGDRDEVPLRSRVSAWSSIGADTSHAQRPDPMDVDVKTPILLFLAPIVVLALGVLVARDLVWDRFLDPFVWQMIVHDRGFNVVNTALWALLLGLLLFFSYRLVQKIGQPVDFLVVFAVVPYMLGGAIVRVMEDTGYFADPLRYFFITPIIYVLIFGVAVLWLVIGWALRRQAQNLGPEAALRSMAGLFGLIWVLYFTWTVFTEDGGTVAQVASPWVLLFALLVPLVYFWVHTRQTGRYSQVGTMATFGSAFMLFALYMLVMWHAGGMWDTVVGCDLKPEPCQSGFGEDTNFWVYPLMIGISGVFVAAVYLIASRKLTTTENAFVFLLPINLLVIFGQTWDALSTSVGIDFLGYREKHWLPGLLMSALEATGIPVLTDYSASFVMVPLKILVAFAVVYLVDIYSRADMAKYPDLVGLVKLAIIMVGVVPGTRNGIRMVMGI